MDFKDGRRHAYVWDTEDDTFEYIPRTRLENALHNGIIIDNFSISRGKFYEWRIYLKGKLFEFNKYPIKILSNNNMLIVWCNGNAVISKILTGYNLGFYIDKSEENLIVNIGICSDSMSIYLGLNGDYCKLGVRSWVESSHFKASWKDTLKKGVLL